MYQQKEIVWFKFDIPSDELYVLVEDEIWEKDAGQRSEESYRSQYFIFMDIVKKLFKTVQVNLPFCDFIIDPSVEKTPPKEINAKCEKLIQMFKDNKTFYGTKNSFDIPDNL